MKIQDNLRSSALFTICGSEEGVVLVESYDPNDYDWVVYVFNGLYDSDYWGTGYGFTYPLIKRLNAHIAGGIRALDMEGKGIAPNLLKLRSLFSQDGDDLGRAASSLLVNSGDPHTIPKQHGLVSPFMGVGTRVPAELSWQKLAAIAAICRSPANTFIQIVGNLDSAKTTLGMGMEGIRAIILSHYGIEPSDSSVPLDMPVPFIWAHSSDQLTMLEVVTNQDTESNSASSHRITWQFKAEVMTAMCLYNLLSDHGYLGFTPPESPSSSWCISSTSSTTPAPYRYPALTGLLAYQKNYRTLRDGVEEAGLEKRNVPRLGDLLKRYGDHSYLTVIARIAKDESADKAMYSILPKIIKSFLVRLYRITCKDVICMPPKKVYPLRSDASRRFAATYAAYSSARSLGDYLSLGHSILSSAVISACPEMLSVTQLVDVSPHCLLLSDSNIPPLPIAESEPSDMPYLLSYDLFSRNKAAWGDIKIVTSQGRVVALSETLEANLQNMLDSLEESLNTSDQYSYITMGKLGKMSDRWGFTVGDITAEDIEDTIVSRVKFSSGCVTGISLKCVIGYHLEYRHPATAKLISMVCKLLSASVMDTFNDSSDKQGTHFISRAVRLCVLDYLNDVLNRARI